MESFGLDEIPRQGYAYANIGYIWVRFAHFLNMTKVCVGVTLCRYFVDAQTFHYVTIQSLSFSTSCELTWVHHMDWLNIALTITVGFLGSLFVSNQRAASTFTFFSLETLSWAFFPIQLIHISLPFWHLVFSERLKESNLSNESWGKLKNVLTEKNALPNKDSVQITLIISNLSGLFVSFLTKYQTIWPVLLFSPIILLKITANLRMSF